MFVYFLNFSRQEYLFYLFFAVIVIIQKLRSGQPAEDKRL